MKSSASESKPLRSRSRAEIPGQARQGEGLGRSKLKELFLIDSYAELFMNLIQGTFKPLLNGHPWGMAN